MNIKQIISLFSLNLFKCLFFELSTKLSISVFLTALLCYLPSNHTDKKITKKVKIDLL